MTAPDTNVRTSTGSRVVRLPVRFAQPQRPTEQRVAEAAAEVARVLGGRVKATGPVRERGDGYRTEFRIEVDR